MPDAPQSRLPRGRHGLSRAEVEQSQRERLLRAMAEAMSVKGYVATSVEDAIKGAGVSRESFYRLFASKLDCFMAALDEAGQTLLQRMAERVPPDGGPMEKFERLMAAYLDGLAAEPAQARLFLVEVHAAGPEAIRHRLDVQQQFAGALAALLDVRTDEGRFACRMVVAATSAMVTGPIVAGDPDALRALGAPIVGHVRRLFEAGIFA